MRVVVVASFLLAMLPARGLAEPCCKDAEPHLARKTLDYRKAAAIYRDRCKPDYSGPADACRQFALAGWTTRGAKLDTIDVLLVLYEACRRGDVAACGWKTWIARDRRVAPADLSGMRAACEAGDRAACEPLFLAIKSARASTSTRAKPCPDWELALAEKSCSRGEPAGCAVVDRLHHQRRCNVTPVSADFAFKSLVRMCEAGDVEACLDSVPNDRALWTVRCKAGEQFACDAIK